MKPYKICWSIIFCLAAFAASAQYNFDEVGKKMDAAKKQLDGGATILIYKDGKIIYKKEAGPDFTIKTPVPIGASSQWLTAALVMTFVDEGLLNLDDKVSQYLPIFKTYGKAYITVRNCLDHFTGIEAPSGITGFFDKKNYPTLEEEVNSFANKHEIQTNPGTEFRFSSIGLNIAGRICEVISKKKGFDRLMLERVTRPCGMRNTSFYNNEKAINPSGGASASALDYINFMTMIMNKGVVNGKKVLSEKAIADMETIQTTPALIKYAPEGAMGYNYGMGVWIQEMDSQGKPAVIGSPSFTGTWPYIDKCRNYTCIFLVKSPLNDARRNIFDGIKRTIDNVIGGECK